MYTMYTIVCIQTEVLEDGGCLIEPHNSHYRVIFLPFLPFTETPSLYVMIWEGVKQRKSETPYPHRTHTHPYTDVKPDVILDYQPDLQCKETGKV